MKQLIVITAFLLAGIMAQAQERFRIDHGPYLQNVDETSATFIWTTNRPGIAWVEIIPVDTTNFYHAEHPRHYAARNGLKDMDTVHTVRINNLQPGTQYRYRVFSQEVLGQNGYEITYGNMVGTKVFQATAPAFRTNDHAKKDINFVMVNDIHERSTVMSSLLKGTDWKNTDMVFFNGDMVSFLRSEEQMFASFMDTAVSVFAKQIPMYYARGNHETRGEFAACFPNYFPGPQGRLYYMFQQGPVCFIVLDGGEDKPDSDIEYSGITSFDDYRTEQAAWLKEVLQTKTFQDAIFRVVVMHIPPFRGWHGEEEIYQKFVPLLNKAGIDIMLCGHLHRNVYRKADPAACNFPILVNSNNSVLKASTENRKMQLSIVDDKGSVVKSLTIDAHK